MQSNHFHRLGALVYLATRLIMPTQTAMFQDLRDLADESRHRSLQYLVNNPEHVIVAAVGAKSHEADLDAQLPVSRVDVIVKTLTSNLQRAPKKALDLIRYLFGKNYSKSVLKAIKNMEDPTLTHQEEAIDRYPFYKKLTDEYRQLERIEGLGGHPVMLKMAKLLTDTKLVITREFVCHDSQLLSKDWRRYTKARSIFTSELPRALCKVASVRISVELHHAFFNLPSELVGVPHEHIHRLQAFVLDLASVADYWKILRSPNSSPGTATTKRALEDFAWREYLDRYADNRDFLNPGGIRFVLANNEYMAEFWSIARIWVSKEYDESKFALKVLKRYSESFPNKTSGKIPTNVQTTIKELLEANMNDIGKPALLRVLEQAFFNPSLAKLSKKQTLFYQILIFQILKAHGLLGRRLAPGYEAILSYTDFVHISLQIFGAYSELADIMRRLKLLDHIEHTKNDEYLGFLAEQGIYAPDSTNRGLDGLARGKLISKAFKAIDHVKDLQKKGSEKINCLSCDTATLGVKDPLLILESSNSDKTDTQEPRDFGTSRHVPMQENGSSQQKLWWVETGLYHTLLDMVQDLKNVWHEAAKNDWSLHRSSNISRAMPWLHNFVVTGSPGRSFVSRV